MSDSGGTRGRTARCRAGPVRPPPPPLHRTSLDRPGGLRHPPCRCFCCQSLKALRQTAESEKGPLDPPQRLLSTPSCWLTFRRLGSTWVELSGHFDFLFHRLPRRGRAPCGEHTTYSIRQPAQDCGENGG